MALASTRASRRWSARTTTTTSAAAAASATTTRASASASRATPALRAALRLRSSNSNGLDISRLHQGEDSKAGRKTPHAAGDARAEPGLTKQFVFARSLKHALG